MNTAIYIFLSIGALIYVIGALWYVVEPRNGFAQLALHLIAGTACIMVGALIRFFTQPLALIPLILCGVATMAVLSIAVERMKEPS